MTLFYYPCAVDTAITLAGKKLISCPWKYELDRLLRLKGSDAAVEQMQYADYCGWYPSCSDDELALKVAGMRHPVDIRMGENGNVPEELWLRAVRLYGKYKTAELHVQTPPRGVILCLDLPDNPQDFLLVPERVSLEGCLKSVGIRADKEQERIIAAAFERYQPEFYRIFKKASF